MGPRLFCWPELRARDAGSAGRFYASLLKGSLVRSSAEGVVIVVVAGHAVAAIGEISDGEHERGVTDHWRFYLVLGRKIASGKSPPRARSRALLASAPGAAVAATQAAAHFGETCTPGAEAVLWGELEHDSPLEASTSCATVLQTAMEGAETSDDSHDGSPYTFTGPSLFHNGGSRRAGVLVGSPDANEAPISNVCLVVDDCASALRRARAAGATIVGPPTELAAGGRVAAIIDPHGAPLFCWQPLPARGTQSRTRAAAARVWPATHRARPARARNA